MTTPPVVDAHQHFWRSASREQTWRKPGHEILARAYLPTDLADELDRVGVDGTVVVQSVNTLEETATLLDIAREQPFVWGVVGWLPLEDPAACSRELERIVGHRELKGIRHLINVEPDPDWIVRDGVVQSLSLLAEHGLTFDVVAITDAHLEHVSSLAGRLPGLRLVVDHLARPPVLEGGWEPWATRLARAAEHPNVYVKLSAGIDVVTDWPAWSAEELQPYVDWTIACFGAQRTMFASNWPVVLLTGPYEQAWRETNRTIAGLSDPDRAAVLGGTAVTFYDLEVTS